MPAGAARGAAVGVAGAPAAAAARRRYRARASASPGLGRSVRWRMASCACGARAAVRERLDEGHDVRVVEEQAVGLDAIGTARARAPPPRRAPARGSSAPGRRVAPVARSDEPTGQVVSSQRARATSSPLSGSRTTEPDGPRAKRRMRFSKRSSLWATRRAARCTISGAQRWFVSRSTRRRPGSRVGEARGPAARRRGATRRWSGRHRRRGRCRARHRPAGRPGPAGSGRGPGPRRRRAPGTARASAPGAPASASSSGGRPGHEVVEVDGSRCCARSAWYSAKASCVATSLGGGPRSGSSLRRVKASSSQRTAVPGSGPPARLARTSCPVDDGVDRHAGLGEDGPAEGVEGADPHAAGLQAQLGQGRVRALLQLLGGATVEGQGADGRGIGARRRRARRGVPRRVVVLPEPAGATQRTGPGSASGRGALVGREAASRSRTASGRPVGTSTSAHRAAVSTSRPLPALHDACATEAVLRSAPSGCALLKGPRGVADRSRPR